MGTNLLVAGMGAVTGVLAARVLGPAGRGELAAIQLWGFFLATLAALGVPDAVVYFTARRRDEAGTYLASASALMFITSCAFVTAGWLVVPVVLGSQSDNVKALAQLFLLIVPVYCVAGGSANALRGRSEFKRWNLLRILAPGLWLGLVLITAMTGRTDVRNLTLGFMGVQMVILVVALIVALPKIKAPYTVDPARWRPMLRFGLPGVLSTVPQLLNLRLDQMLLVAFVSAEQLGLYVAAVAWAGVVAPVLGALGSVIFPRIAGEDDVDEQMRVLTRGIRLSSVVAAAVVIGVFSITPFSVRLLFGVDYAASIPAALVLVVAGGLLAVNGVFQEGFRGLGRPAEVLWTELGGLVATAALLAMLLRPLGILGAALASVGGYSVTTAVCVVRLRRHAGRPLGRELLASPGDVRDVFNSVRALLPGRKS